MLLINVESEAELRLLDRIAGERSGTIAPVGLRVNPEVTVDTPHAYIKTGEKGHKFGIPYDEVLRRGARGGVAAERRARRARHAHRLAAVARRCRTSDGIERLTSACSTQFGASGIDVAPLPRHRWRARRVVRRRGSRPTSSASRELVVPLLGADRPHAPHGAGALHRRQRRACCSRACCIASTAAARSIVITDAGMTELLRPSHYDAYHRIEAVQPQRRVRSSADVVGPVCESGDFLALDREMPTTSSAGDLLAVHDVGAYGYVHGVELQRAAARRRGARRRRSLRGRHGARDVRGPGAARAQPTPTGGTPDARRTDGGHARSVPAIAELRARDAGAPASAMVLHAGDYCAPFSLKPFEDAQHVARRACSARNDGDHAGPARHGRGRASASSCSSRRTASRSAGQQHPRSCTTSATCSRGRIEAHSIVVHGFTHQQEMKTRGDTLIVNPGEACGWLYGTPTAAILDLDTKKVEFISARRTCALDDLTAAQPDPHHRLRLAVHAADRAPRPRSARVLRDPSADAHARVDPRVEADRHHPQRRPELGLRRGRADRRSARCSTSRRSSASATGCSSSRTSQGGAGHRAAAEREYGRAELEVDEPERAVRGIRREGAASRCG